MSTQGRMIYAVKCDSCGIVLDPQSPSSLQIRITAGSEGWKYGRAQRRPRGDRGQRDFDFCPNCLDKIPDGVTCA